MAKRKMAAECEDFEEFYWPARCRGYLEGKRASDCLANIELARLRRGPCDICRNWYREVDRLRAENERLRAVLRPYEDTAVTEGHRPGLACCPICRQCSYIASGIEHRPDCRAAAALKDEP